jgi:hypothetical protein
MDNEELGSDTLGFNWEGGNTLFLMTATQSNKQLIQDTQDAPRRPKMPNQG